MSAPAIDSAALSSKSAHRGGERVDRFGAIASSLCAVHCAICALLPAAFGALGLGVLSGHEAEWVFTIIAVAFAVGALLLGWRRHRSVLVAGLLIAGIVGLVASRALEMSGEHDGHDAAPAHAQAESSSTHGHVAKEHAAKEHAAKEHATHAATSASASHDDAAHLAGTVVAVLAGLLLLWGICSTSARTDGVAEQRVATDLSRATRLQSDAYRSAAPRASAFSHMRR